MRALWLLLPLAFVSCTSDPDPEPETPMADVELVFRGYWGGEFKLGQDIPDSRFQTVWNFDQFQFYLCNVRLLKADGTEVLLENPGGYPVTFVDFKNGHSGSGKTQHDAFGTYISLKAPEGEYVGVKFDIGVPPEINTGETAPFINDPNHPFHPENQMGWVMANGYILVRTEGRFDSDTNATPDAGFAYHLGGNANYLSFTFNDPVGQGIQPFSLKKGVLTHIGFDLLMDWLLGIPNQPATTIDPHVVPEVHSPNATATTFGNNLKTSLFFHDVYVD